MNLGEAKQRVMQLIDEYSVRGSVVGQSDGNVADYYRKVKNVIDMAQKKVAEQRYIYKTKTYTHILPVIGRPFLGLFNNAGTFHFHSPKAYAYSFKVLGNATAHIEAITNGTSNTITTIDCVGNGEIKAYSANLDEDADGFQIRFEGNGFTVKSPAMFNAPITEIPFIDEYIEYPLPDNCNRILKITCETYMNKEYKEFAFNTAGKIGLALNRQGIVNLTYAAYPTTITPKTEDTFELELDPNGINAMCFYAAALLLQLEDYSAYTSLMQQYLDIMANSQNKFGLAQKRVKMVW